MSSGKVNGNSIKALVTDIDGTITDDKRRVSTKVIEALRNVEVKGIPVLLASGNVLPIAYGLAGFIGVTGPVIAENGGVVYYNRTVKYLGDRKKCDEAFDELKKHLPVKKIFSDRWRKAALAIEPDVDLDEVKKCVSGFGLRAESTGFAIHIFEPQVGKFNALIEACKLLNIDLTEIAAFGDSENDIEMIKNSCVGLVPFNASVEIKKHADFIASTAYGDGFLEGLKWLGLAD